MSNYLRSSIEPATIPQSQPVAPTQVPNSAGGFTFQLTDRDRVRRFLILGSEGGTYYTSEQKLTIDNVDTIKRLATTDGTWLVNEIVAVPDAGRAPKNDPAILALAVCAKLGDEATRRLAHAALPKVCRIGTHVYHFAHFVNQLGGWGRATTRSIGDWFNARPSDDLAHQLIKYRQRDGWSARDLLRLTHPKASTNVHDALFAWACRGFDGAAELEKDTLLPPVIHAFEELQTASASRAAKLISAYKLPREAVPGALLTDPSIWEALLPHMGLTALIRNLATMTRVGILAPLGAHAAAVAQRIDDTEALKTARVHPIAVLSALRTYETGQSVRGDSTWTPVQLIVDALDSAFYKAFQTITPTGKATLLALDVSGSMDGGVIAGCPGLDPRTVSAAMALVTAATEPRYCIVGFSHHLVDVPISPKMRLDQTIEVMRRIPMGNTDCSLPFTWALQAKVNVEACAVYTDSETYAGRVHPHIALKTYREKMGVATRSAVVGCTSTAFTIADPGDAGMLDVVGFDAAAPAVMADFFAGR